MPQQDPLKPGQVANLPQNTYDPNAEAGKVTSNLPYVAPPTAPNLLFDNTAPTTAGGASKVNPAYALYINTLKNNNTKQAYLNTPYYTKQSATERYSDNELGGYHPYDMNLENWYGDNQSWFKQWGNRLGKFGTKIVGSFANSMMDVPNVIAQTSTGEMSLDKLWDNPTNNWATDLMAWSEKNMPNYETNWEREHPFANLIPFYGNSGNGWGKIVENLGFTVGAVGGAVAEDAIVGFLTGGVGEIPLAAAQINKAVYKLGKLINSSDDALSGLKASIKSADDIVKGLKGIDRFNYAVRQGLWGANMITSGISEAAFEGIESYKNLSKDLQQQFLEENSRMPSYEDNQKIDSLAREAANSRFLLNSALLAVTNSIQWGNLIRPLNATKDLIEAEAKQGVRVALKEGSIDAFEAIDKSSKIARWGRKAINNKVAQNLIGSSSEGFEEGAQFAIESGVNDYYKRKYNAGNIQQANSFLASFSKGMSDVLGTQEGWENIVYGLLGGSMYKAGEHAYYKLRGIDNNPNYKRQIDAVIEGLNTNTLSGVFENKYAEAVDAIAIQKDLQQAAADGNVFLYKNYKHDQFVNFILSGIQQNKFDTRMEQLQELKKLDKDQFEKMFGIPSSEENKATVADYVDSMEKNARYINSIHKRVSRTFINPFVYKGTGNYKNKEEKEKQDFINEQHRIYEGVKEDLVRTMSISKDSVNRIGNLKTYIGKVGGPVFNADEAVMVESEEGLAELKAKYKERLKTLKLLAQTSLNPQELQKINEELKAIKENTGRSVNDVKRASFLTSQLRQSEKTEQDQVKLSASIKHIEDILSEKDEEKKDALYQQFMLNFYTQAGKEKAEFYQSIGETVELDQLFHSQMIKDIRTAARDVYHLKKQNEAAIDRYARLTTKNGFKEVFDSIKEMRAQAAELQVVPETPVVQGQAAQQQTAFNAAQAQQGQSPTKQPQDQNPAQAQPGDTQVDMNGYVEETITPIGADQLEAIKRILVRIAEGQEKVSEEELHFSRDLEFGFKTIDDIKSENPKANLNDFIKVKATDTGKFYYMSKANLAALKAELGNPIDNSSEIDRKTSNSLDPTGERYVHPAIVLQKFNPDGPNRLLTDEELELADARIEKTIQRGITNNNTALELLETFNASYLIGGGSERRTLLSYFEDRLSGKISIPFSEFRKDVYESIAKVSNVSSAATITSQSGGLRTNDFLGKVYVPQDTKGSFNNAIFSGTKDQVRDGLRIVVRPLSPEFKKEFDQQKAKQSYTPLDGFPGVYVSKTPIDLSIYHSSVREGISGLIGKVGYPKRLLFKLGNQFVTIDKLTPEQYAQFTKRSAAQHATDVDEFNKQVAFTNLLATIFKGNNNQEFTLTEEDLEGIFDIAITYGEEDRVEKDQDRPPFNELKYNGITIPTKDGNIKTMVILSVPRRFSGDELVRERTGFSEPIYGQNFYDSPTADDSKISEYRNSNPEQIAKIGSRYVGLVEKPDGTIHPIALRPDELTTQGRETLFNSIKSRSIESAEANFVEGTEQDNSGVLLVGDKKVYYKLPSDTAKSFNDSFNTELNNQTFISDRNERSWLNLSISPIGAVRLEVHEPDVIWTNSDGKQQKGFRAKLYIAPQVVVNLNSFYELIDQLNKEIDKESAKNPIFKSLNIKLEPSSFRQYIAKDSAIQNAEQIAPLLTASTTREVFKNGTMRILPDIEKVQKIYNEVNKNANQQNTPEQTKQGEQSLFDQLQTQTPGGIENIDQVTEINKRRQSEISGIEQITDPNHPFFQVGTWVNAGAGLEGKTKEELIQKINTKYDAAISASVVGTSIVTQTSSQVPATPVAAPTSAEEVEQARQRDLEVDGRLEKTSGIIQSPTGKFGVADGTQRKWFDTLEEAQNEVNKKYDKKVDNTDKIVEINRRREEELEESFDELHPYRYAIDDAKKHGSQEQIDYAIAERKRLYDNLMKSEKAKMINDRYDAEIAALNQTPITPTSILGAQQPFVEEDYNTIEDLFGEAPTGMFAGLTPTDIDASGEPIINTEVQGTQNQEDVKDIEFNSVKEALNANDIDYESVDGGIRFFVMSTDDPLDLSGVSPKELAAEMGLKVKEQQKPSSGGFDFMRANSEVKALNKMMDIENAKTYIQSILPSSIKVQEVSDVLDELREQGIEDPEKDVWGAFRDGVIYLNSQAPAVGQEYHEAFHAVFNTFVPQQQKQVLLDDAKNSLYKKLKKEGKSIRQHITEQRASGVWTNISDTQAAEKAAEEWMAEEFRAWKNKKNSAGFLDKLFDLIDRFFRWILRNGSDLDALFRKIDTGGYRYSNIAGNAFTQDTTDENTTQEFKFMLIPTRPTQIQIGKGTRTKKNNLDAKTSKQVVQNVAAYFEMYRKTGEFKKISDDKLLDEILDNLKLTYDPKNALYAGASQEKLNAIANSDQNFIYSDENSRKIIKEAAKKYINSMNYFEQFGEDELETEQQDTGAPKTGYDNQSENIGGFSSIPGMLRHYIGFTNYPITDQFGNEKLENGLPVIATVDAVSVYYGLLRATANINDPVRFFQRMIKFADNNEQSRHFVKKFIKDSGLDEDILFGENRIVAKDGGNKALIEIVRKGFNKYRIDYTFTEYDMAKAKYNSYPANRRNVENVQFDKWSNTFIAGYAEMGDAAKRSIQTALDNVRNKYFDERRVVLRSEEEQRAIINEARNALLGVGIQVSYDYIRYSLLSIAAKKFDALNTQYKTQGVELQFDDPKNTFISKADYNYVQVMKIADEIALTKDFMDELSKGLASNANPFFREIRKRKIIDPHSQEEVEIEEELDTAMVTRILNIGKGNAFFDETVGESSFTTADNKVVFAHQDGTFNVKASYALRDANFRKQLRENGYREEATSYMDVLDSEWLTNNHLLKSNDFEAVADNLLYQNIDGMRAVETNSKGKVITQEFRDQKEGVTYGSYSAREFFINNLNFYVSGHKVQKTNKGDVITAPHLIRVLEASKTGATVNLPVNLDIYRDGTVTDKTLKLMLEEVTKEYNRIQRVQGEIGKITENVVENYHTGSFKVDSEGNPTDEVDKGYRGLKFSDNMTSLISKTTAEMLERKARAGQPLSEQDKASIKEEIKTSLNNMVEDTIDLMTREGIIKKGSAMGNYQNVLLDNEFFNGNAALNLQTVDSDIKFKTNIGHVLINDYINTLAYNQILHGDPALSLKNDGGIDAVKRAKGDNAAIVSIRTDLIDPSLGITKPFTHSSIAIFKEPIIDKIKVADAQMYTTTEGLRYTLWGLGRLSPRVAAFIDALERGDDIHALKDSDGKIYDGVFDDDSGLLRWDEMTNSLKLVYKDGKTYFKMSVVVLQPNLTAMKNEQGEWETLPGWETLDTLRRKMEADGIHFAAPESASKMMTLDVSKAKDFSDLKGHLFDNTFFGLQTENPSNKLEITTPTQLLQLIDSEQDDSVEVFVAGAKTTVGAIKNQYQEAVAQKVTNAYEVARDEIYNITDFNDDIDKLIQDGKVEPRLARFYERVSSTLEASGADAQLQEFFELDENGNIKYNANLSAIKTKAQQLYLAYFSKGIMSQKSPGYTVALFSGINTKTVRRATKVENGQVVAWEHVRRDQWASNHKGVRDQRILGKDQITAVGQLFTDELQYNVPEYDKDGNITGYYSEMMLPAHFAELLGLKPGDDIPEAIAKMFGVRIPSQDKHSFISLKLVDFLPANLGSTGMFPKEIVKLSGADFDIDKLYITRPDFYTTKDKNGITHFKKYGSATNDQGKWSEYKRWMLENNKSVKNTVRDILQTDRTYQDLLDEQSTLRELQMEDAFDDAAKQLKKNLYNKATAQAFKALKLPSTLEEFVEASKTRELNNGVLNNKILDYYVALQTNKGMQDIAKTPATLTALENVQKNSDITLRDKEGNIIASVFEKKTNYPVDSPIGKYYGFRNNTTGKNNIGIDVNANLIYSVLNKGNVRLENAKDIGEDIGFIFDGQHFGSFAGNREYNIETGKFDGKRTNDILSTLITAATDEAKEQLNALYNLGVDALKVVNYLVSLKVPLKTAIYFVNQPSVRNYLELKAVKQNNIQTADEDKLKKDTFQEEAKKKTYQQIRDYKDISDKEMMDIFTRNGIIEINC